MNGAHNTLHDKVSRLPNAPGCYLLQDGTGKIIYVGKAKDLRARVRAYLNPAADQRPHMELLFREWADLDFIVTTTEKEALILENRLIKKHRPRYNILLRDDKNYLSIRLDITQPFPRPELVRRIKDDGARYFGPYDSAGAARKTLQLLHRLVMLRSCNDRVFRQRTRPCLQCQMRRCQGPCCQLISPEQYKEHVRQAILFLEGRATDLQRELKAEMARLAEAMEYERAAVIRDRIQALERTVERQRVVLPGASDADVLAMYREGGRVQVAILRVRQGGITGMKSYPLDRSAIKDEDVLASFVSVHYDSATPLPEEILLPLEIPLQEATAEWLSELRGRRVRIIHPQRGDRRKLIDMAEANARAAFHEARGREEQVLKALERLAELLHLPQTPRRIECVDISNLQGSNAVGSVVAFLEGRPEKGLYRSYNIRSVVGPNDVGAIGEVITRRMSRSLLPEAEDDRDAPPDLLIIDGGQGQLNAAMEALEELGLGDISVVALAKGRKGAHGEVTVERVFLPGVGEAVELPAHTAERFLLERIRDEAHRFAITKHRARRTREEIRSPLLDVPGIGPKRAKALLRHFGSLKGIAKAGEAEIAAVEGMSKAAAKAVKLALDEL